MAKAVSNKYYCSTASFAGTTFGALTTTAPPQTNSTIGWISGRNNPPLYSELNWNAEVSRLSTQWQSPPTQSIPSQNAGGSGDGNCFIMGPFNGEFVAGSWTITMSIISPGNVASHQGRLLYRMWTSPTGSGATATLISSSFISSSVGVVASTTVPAICTASFVLPQVNLHNEYVLVQTYWAIITNPGGGVPNNATDNTFILGTGSLVNPTGFVSNRTRATTWIQGSV